MAQDKQYDTSWDDDNEELWDQKYEECEIRNWRDWLLENLSFPFEAEIKEDLTSNPFSSDQNQPFSIGHVVKVLEIEGEDEDYGIIVKAKEERKTGYIPLCDVEVTSRENENFWPVREYVVWFANQ